MRFLSVNIGYITNSSSCVHHFPRAVWEDAQVQAWIKTYELQAGYVGEYLWSRQSCSSVLVTKEQKEQALAQLRAEEYSEYGPAIDTEDDSVVVIYGDEYHDTTHILCELLSSTAERLGFAATRQDYN